MIGSKDDILGMLQNGSQALLDEPYLKRKAFQHSQRSFWLGQVIDFLNQCRSYSFIRSYYIKCLHNFIPYTSFLYSVLIHT